MTDPPTAAIVSTHDALGDFRLEYAVVYRVRCGDDIVENVYGPCHIQSPAGQLQQCREFIARNHDRRCRIIRIPSDRPRQPDFPAAPGRVAVDPIPTRTPEPSDR